MDALIGKCKFEKQLSFFYPNVCFQEKLPIKMDHVTETTLEENKDKNKDKEDKENKDNDKEDKDDEDKDDKGSSLKEIFDFLDDACKSLEEWGKYFANLNENQNET